MTVAVRLICCAVKDFRCLASFKVVVIYRICIQDGSNGIKASELLLGMPYISFIYMICYQIILLSILRKNMESKNIVL